MDWICWLPLRRVSRLVDRQANGVTMRYNGLVSRYEAVKAQFDEVTQMVADKADRKKLLEQFLHTVNMQEPITEFDERL